MAETPTESRSLVRSSSVAGSSSRAELAATSVTPRFGLVVVLCSGVLLCLQCGGDRGLRARRGRFLFAVPLGVLVSGVSQHRQTAGSHERGLARGALDERRRLSRLGEFGLEVELLTPLRQRWWLGSRSAAMSAWRRAEPCASISAALFTMNAQLPPMAALNGSDMESHVPWGVGSGRQGRQGRQGRTRRGLGRRWLLSGMPLRLVWVLLLL